MANVPPDARNDSYNTAEDSVLRVGALQSILRNDIDPDRDALTVVEVNGLSVIGTTITLASGAKLKLNANGTFDYDPNGAFNYLLQNQTAVDSFTYKISDGHGGFDTATVNIAIKGINSKPIARVDTDQVTTGTVTNGNVITGLDPDSADKKLVLQADTLGDGTNFIRSITHDGITYTLNAAKTAVSVSGSPTPPGSWSYNNGTGDLTIRTELGGTLKVNLDGATPGQYTYTAPESVRWGTPIQ